MPRIRCHYDDCAFLEEGYCGAAAVELEPETGCLTYSQASEAEAEDEWDEEFDDEYEEDEDLYEDEEEDDLWDDEEDEDEY